MASSGRPDVREAGISYRSTACNRKNLLALVSSRKILIAAVSPIRNPTIYESFESPHPLRLYTQRLERSRLPLGLLCFGNCWWQVASANPSAPRASHSSHRMHRAPASLSIASHRDRPDQNNRIVKEIARSFIDCTTAVYRYRLRRIFKKGTPGTIVITRRLMLI